MEKKLLAFASSVILMGMITTGFAATPVNASYSPFKDNLTIHFVGFPHDTYFYASYENDNGVNISGPAFATTDYDASVTISSQNKLSNGYPSMSMLYPALYSDQKCKVTFMDGPYLPYLIYKSDKTPVCPGVTFSDIQKVSQNNYSVTLTDNEP
jgi:hypothetical protein